MFRPADPQICLVSVYCHATGALLCVVFTIQCHQSEVVVGVSRPIKMRDICNLVYHRFLCINYYLIL